MTTCTQTIEKLNKSEVLPFFQEEITAITPQRNKHFYSCMSHSTGTTLLTTADNATTTTTERINYLTKTDYENSFKNVIIETKVESNS